jgi:hypothetical protein
MDRIYRIDRIMGKYGYDCEEPKPPRFLAAEAAKIAMPSLPRPAGAGSQ